jgi:hypothetical protein
MVDSKKRSEDGVRWTSSQKIYEWSSLSQVYDYSRKSSTRVVDVNSRTAYELLADTSAQCRLLIQ